MIIQPSTENTEKLRLKFRHERGMKLFQSAMICNIFMPECLHAYSLILLGIASIGTSLLCFFSCPLCYAAVLMDFA